VQVAAELRRIDVAKLLRLTRVLGDHKERVEDWINLEA
jgi:hypothetical protein